MIAQVGRNLTELSEDTEPVELGRDKGLVLADSGHAITMALLPALADN